MADNTIKVFHNPRCSKSRMALSYLDDKGVSYQVVEYLKERPNAKELKEIVDLLNMKPLDLVRKNEEAYKLLKGKDQFTDQNWIDAMVENPKLIERPIVIHNSKAVVARPSERIDEIL